METYDKSKVGKFIAWGSEHFVYEYGESEVIKFSILPGKRAKRKVLGDYKICKQFFSSYLLPTRGAISPNGRSIAIIQPRIISRYLKKQDLQDPVIKVQYREIMQGYEALKQNGHAPLDLMGKPGVLHGCLGNIIVTPENRLLIIDTDLLELKFYSLIRPLVPSIRALILWRQNQIIKNFHS